MRHGHRAAAQEPADAATRHGRADVHELPEVLAGAGVANLSAWLGVHAPVRTGVRNRIDALVTSESDSFTSNREPQLLDRADTAQIDRDEDSEPVAAP